jgi:hypothetical protein
MKKALGLLVALGAMALMSVSAYAATYSVESSGNGDTVTLTVKADADTASSAVNGYALSIAYNSDVLEPVSVKESDGTTDATDDTGSVLYAENKLDSGVFVASTVSTTDSDAVAVAWADASPVDVTDGKELAVITFSVVDTDVDSTEVQVAVKADASSSTELVTHSEEAAAATITLGADYLLGDINNDGKINVTDSGLLFQYVSGSVTLESLDEKYPGVSNRADITANGKVDVLDNTILFQYVSGSRSSLDE